MRRMIRPLIIIPRSIITLRPTITIPRDLLLRSGWRLGGRLARGVRAAFLGVGRAGSRVADGQEEPRLAGVPEAVRLAAGRETTGVEGGLIGDWLKGLKGLKR